MSAETFGTFRRRRAALTELIRRLRAVALEVDSPSFADLLAKLEASVLNDAFSLMVMGEFSGGKSTLINALLGQRVLPVFDHPTTAIICQVRYGDHPRAILHPLPTAAGTPAPVEIPIDDLARYVVFEEDRPKPYERVELFWPLGLCREGVEVVDMPDLTEHPVREQAMYALLERADAAVFISNIITPLSESEWRVLDHVLLRIGREKIFLVFNKVNLIPDEERETAVVKITNRVQRRKAGEDDEAIKANRLFFIDARGALESRLADDRTAFEASGLERLERELEQFLTAERGLVKLLLLARELRDAQVRCGRLIAERECMCDMELEDLVARYEAEKPRLLELEMRCTQIEMALLHGIEELADELPAEISRFIRTLLAEYPVWARELDLQNRVAWSLINTSEQVAKVREMLLGVINDRLYADLRAWQDSTLQSLVEQRVSALESQVEDDLKEFFAQIDQSRINIAGGDERLAIDPVYEGAMERVLAGSAGLSSIDPSLTFTGGKFGATSMLKGALPQTRLAVATILGASRLIIPPPPLRFDAIPNVMRLDMIIAQVATEIAAQIDKAAARWESDLARDLRRRLRRLAGEVSAGLQVELSSVREQADARIRDKRSEAHSAKRRALLKDLTAELKSLEQALREFVGRTQQALQAPGG